MSGELIVFVEGVEEAKVETFGYGNRDDAERIVAEARTRADI